MPLNKKGKKILASMKKQYGNKKGENVFYAMENSGKLKGIKKAYSGDFMSAETSRGMYESGRAAAQAFQDSYQGGDSGGSGGTTPKGDTAQKTVRDFKTITNFATDTGGSLGKQFLYNKLTKAPGFEYALIEPIIKTVGPKVQRALTPQTVKDTTTARLTGSPTYKYQYKPQPVVTPPGGDSDSGTQIAKLPYPPIGTQAPSNQLLQPLKDFFPFRAYNNGGGVKSGPPPKRGPNPQVPPIKLKNGGVKTTNKKNVSMRGVGKAIKGLKVTKVY